MSTKDREIQVYEMNEDQIPSDWPRDFVAHSDHLRAVKLAQIAVCDDMQVALFKHYGGPLCSFETEWLASRAEALRKELEG